MCAFEDPSKGALLKGVFTSDARPFWRHTVSAAKKPPGVRVIPLNWIEVGGPAVSWLEPAFATPPLTATPATGPTGAGVSAAGGATVFSWAALEALGCSSTVIIFC